MSLRLAFSSALLVVLLGPVEALAHDGLLRSVPAKDAHLGVAPTALRLTFNRAPTLSLVRMALYGAGDTAVALAPLRLDSGTTVVADIEGALKSGAYRVTWQITGADGHPVRGEFRFTVALGATDSSGAHAGHAAMDTSTPAPHHDPVTMPTSSEFGVQSPAFVAVRWAGLSTLVLLIGAIVFRLGVLGRLRPDVAEEPGWAELAEGRLARLASIASVLFLLATMARLVAQSLALHGAEETFDGALLRGLLLETTWGRAWIAQVVAVVGILALLRASGRIRWVGAAIACVVVAVAQAASGHAASVGNAAIGVDALHVIAAAGWIGGLAALLAVGIPAALTTGEARRFALVAQVLRRFSPMALVFGGLVALSGTFSAWSHLGELSALWTSDYGKTLLWKLGILSLVAATGAYNWKRVLPTVHESVGTARLKRSAGFELAVAAVVIAVTAVLVATPPPDMSPAVASSLSPTP